MIQKGWESGWEVNIKGKSILDIMHGAAYGVDGWVIGSHGCMIVYKR